MNYRDRDSDRDRSTIEPGKRGGKQCIRGMRMTVHGVLDYLLIQHELNLTAVRAEPSKPRVREARREQETDFPDNRALFGHFSYFVTY